MVGVKVFVDTETMVEFEQLEQVAERVIFLVAVVVVGIRRSIQIVVRERWCGIAVVGQVDRETVRLPCGMVVLEIGCLVVICIDVVVTFWKGEVVDMTGFVELF